MAFEKGSRPEGGFKRRGPARRRKKVCVFCGKENNEIDYKDVALSLIHILSRNRKATEKNWQNDIGIWPVILQWSAWSIRICIVRCVIHGVCGEGKHIENWRRMWRRL